MKKKICIQCYNEKLINEYHVGSSRCKSCIKIKSAEYYRTHKDEMRKSRKESYQKNIAKFKERGRLYYLANKEAKKAWQKKYREDDKERAKRQHAAHYQRHKEEIKKKTAEWYLANVSKMKEAGIIYRQSHKEQIYIRNKLYHQTEKGRNVKNKAENKRRALKLGAGYEDFDPTVVLERDRYICQKCGKKTRPDYKNPNRSLYPNLDHIVPLSKGGAHTSLNTQCLCHQCNMKKYNTGAGDQLRLFGI